MGELKEDQEMQIRRQIEFYFSAGNLGQDLYLRSLMNLEGWIDLNQLMKFPRLLKLGARSQMIPAMFAGSAVVEVSPDGRRVRQANPILRTMFPPMPKRGGGMGGAPEAKKTAAKLKAAAQKRRAAKD